MVAQPVMAAPVPERMSAPDSPCARERRLLLFAKTPVAGRVKTRLVTPGGLTPSQAAALHAALVGDLTERLVAGGWELVLMWALAGDEVPPADPGSGRVPWRSQNGADLGERLYRGFDWATSEAKYAAAVGSDHPELGAGCVEEAFRRLESGADAVLGPARDGGYYLMALRREAVHRRLFEGLAWSTPSVLAGTLERCRELELDVSLLAEGRDLDTPSDLARFRRELDRLPGLRSLCPRSAEVIDSWSQPQPGDGR